MSYEINYGNSNNKKYISNQRTPKTKPILIFFLASVLALLCLIKPVRSSIEAFLIPGDDIITKNAAQNMLNELQDGRPFKDAFASFCIEIINHE